MRLLMVGGLILGLAAALGPQDSSELVHSVLHGFGWGVGREIANGLFGHRHW
jgi:hypothetical protein